jgi:MFS family permease
MEAPSPEIIERDRHFPFNFTVNMIDGAGFGFALGFASFTTIIPLFVSSLTDSALLIGLIPAIHVLGWQLPQLFTARSVARRKHYKPMVMFFTTQERLPFLAMAAVAWFVPGFGPRVALIITFLTLIWQAVGAGFTATPWQSMIAKIVPADRWGIFFGSQSAAANLFASGSAVLAGVILDRFDSPLDFTLCFLLSSVGMTISYIFLGLTREADSLPPAVEQSQSHFWNALLDILKQDANFRWFLLVRVLAQVGTMGFAFYTVYAVRHLGVSEVMIGVMTGVLTIVQTAANPLMGWLGDRWIHRGVMIIGLSSAVLSSFLAWLAPQASWFFLVFALAGIANVGIWTISMTITLEFGDEHSRPSYIGLANTLVAPTAFVIPLIGGLLADNFGYPSAFIVSVVGGIATILVLIFLLRTPKEHARLLKA